jgi:hypothetical protein
MAKRGRRVLPARKKERDDDSLLIRSAESLGRVIGSLQRQVQSTSKRVSSVTSPAIGPWSPARKRATTRVSEVRQSSKDRKSSARKTAGARKEARSRKRAVSRPSSKKR